MNLYYFSPMKYIFLLPFFLFPTLTFGNTYIQKKIDGHTMRVVKFPLDSQMYDIKIVKTYTPTTLGEILHENNAFTGVNGVFFCPPDYGWCNTDIAYTDNEHYIQGEKHGSYNSTGDRAVFGWTKEKEPFLFQTDHINPEREWEIYYGFGNYPLLLQDGQDAMEYYSDRGLIDAGMRRSGTRNFVCSDKDGENIYFGLVYEASLSQMPQILLQLGCTNALNLDAGASTSFMYNNRYLAGPPKRKIIDALAVEAKGINISEVNQKADTLVYILTLDTQARSRGERELEQKYISYYKTTFEQIRIALYGVFTTDIVEKNNFIDEDDVVWYQIDIKNTRHLRAMLLINAVFEGLKNVERQLNH